MIIVGGQMEYKLGLEKNPESVSMAKLDVCYSKCNYQNEDN